MSQSAPAARARSSDRLRDALPKLVLSPSVAMVAIFVYGFILFTIYFFKELLVANLKMARYTLTPLSQLKPGILSIPIRPDMTDTEVTVLANMITLTPGTLSMDISADRTTLFVHFMHMDDPEAQRREIVEGFERRLLELTR